MVDPARLYRLLVDEEVHFAEFVPSVLRGLLDFSVETDSPLSFLRTVVVGSDRWYVREHRRLRDACGPGTCCVQSFGLTETSIDTAFYEGATEGYQDHELTPIGRTFDNVTVEIVDESLNSVAPDEVGEMLIGGAGVTRGYLGRPALTAERFLPDPRAAAGARIYRTGDLARLRPDGTIQFVGRNDRQVKVRGFRVEPGELESVFERHPAVRRCVVVPLMLPEGDRTLVAFIVTGPPRGPDKAVPTAADLRAFLGERVPAHMLPQDIVMLDELPLTSSGKVNRDALLQLRAEQLAALAPREPPRDPMEAAIADIWARVLGTEGFGSTDNFFHLGGHSLHAGRVLAHIHAVFGANVTLAAFFENPTVAALARLVAAADTDTSGVTLTRMPRNRRIPASLPQQQLWLHEQLHPGTAAYNLAIHIEVPGAFELRRRRTITAAILTAASA